MAGGAGPVLIAGPGRAAHPTAGAGGRRTARCADGADRRGPPEGGVRPGAPTPAGRMRSWRPVASPTQSPGRSRRRWPWVVVLVVVLAWVAAVALMLLAVDRHVRAGVAAVSSAQGALNASTISDPNSPDVLAPVVRDFGAAHRDLDSPLLWPVRLVPIAGRQVRAVRNLANAAQQVGAIGETAITRARAALRAPHGTGPQRVAAIQALASAAKDADAGLARVSLGSRSALIGAITKRYDDFANRLARVRTGVHKGAIAATQTAALL